MISEVRRSVTNMCPGACVITSGSLASIMAVCGVTPQLYYMCKGTNIWMCGVRFIRTPPSSLFSAFPRTYMCVGTNIWMCDGRSYIHAPALSPFVVSICTYMCKETKIKMSMLSSLRRHSALLCVKRPMYVCVMWAGCGVVLHLYL